MNKATLISSILLLIMAAMGATGCASRSPVFSPAEVLSVEAQASDPASIPSVRIAVVPFIDERGEPHLRRNHWTKIPLVEAVASFCSSETSHPERTLLPLADEPATHTAARAFARALHQAAPGATVDFLPGHSVRNIPANYDLVVEGRLRSTRVEYRMYDYGLNFFNVLDLSPIPKGLGLPTRRVVGTLEGEVFLRDRADGRVAGREAFLWRSAPISEGYYSKNSIMERLVMMWAAEGLETAAKAVAEKVVKFPS